MIHTVYTKTESISDLKSYWVHTSTCNHQTYYPNSQLCCDGVIHHRVSSEFKCCNTQTYNSQISTCSNGVIDYNIANSINNLDISCCDEIEYNAGSYLCYNGVLVWTLFVLIYWFGV